MCERREVCGQMEVWRVWTCEWLAGGDASSAAAAVIPAPGEAAAEAEEVAISWDPAQAAAAPPTPLPSDAAAGDPSAVAASPAPFFSSAASSAFSSGSAITRRPPAAAVQWASLPGVVPAAGAYLPAPSSVAATKAAFAAAGLSPATRDGPHTVDAGARRREAVRVLTPPEPEPDFEAAAVAAAVDGAGPRPTRAAGGDEAAVTSAGRSGRRERQGGLTGSLSVRGGLAHGQNVGQSGRQT